jgi:hypothetical protein
MFSIVYHSVVIRGTNIALRILPENEGARTDETHHPFSQYFRLLNSQCERP